MRRLSTFAGIGIAVTLLLTALAGCGSGSSHGSSAGSVGTGASGDTIKLMVIGELSSPVMALPQLVVGAQAGVNEVNAAGGINGRKIVLLSCNTQTDPNVAASCARKAVSEKVSAVVGMLSLEGNAVQTILAAAKIPTIANQALDPLDYGSPNSFPIITAPVAIVGMALTMPGYKECKHPALLQVNNPTAQVGGTLVKHVYSQLGIGLKIVDVDIQATDVRSQVATLLSGGTDCVFGAVPPTIGLGLVKAVGDSGQKVKMSQVMTAVPLASMRQLGAAAQGVYASSPYREPGTSPAADKFAREMTAIDPKAVQDDAAEGAYTGVLIFAQVTKSLTDFSAPNVLDALNLAKNIDVGTIAPISSFPANGGIPGAPRIDVTQMYSYVFRGDNFELVAPNPVDTKTGLS
jgi:ABC-type branched-subunit amino acid transport system substrate-binding protein